MKKKLKAAVVGCGAAGVDNHLRWYAGHPGVDVCGIVDADIGRARDRARHYGGRPYGSLAEMLGKEKPDMASVATPGNLHMEHTVECLNHGCHVLCEKPMAPTLEECRKMTGAARKSNLVLGIVADRRFDTGYQQARRLILSGEIGVPLFTRVHWIANCADAWSAGYRGKLKTGGGAFQDCGSHYIDICCWWLDSCVSSVEGTIDICRPEILEVEDQAVAVLRFGNGISGLIETSWVGPMGYRCNGIHAEIHENWIYGTKGTMKVLGNREPAGIDIWDKKTGEWRIVPVPGANQFHRYKRMIDEFISCVREGKGFAPSGEDGEKTIGVVLGLYQSSFTGRKVALPLKQTPDIRRIFTELRAESLKRRHEEP